MPLLFTCPHCQTMTQVDDRYSGQSGHCVTCGGPIEIPRFVEREPLSTVGRDGERRPDQFLRWVVAAMVAVVLSGGLLLALLRVGGQTVGQLASNRDRTASMRNLQKIASALNAYAADYGTYPPSRTVDDRGRPLHSWRVLILPYLGEDELYSNFDLNAAWDDPGNMHAAFQMPECYQHPDRRSAGSDMASAYYLVTGPGTLNPASGPLAPRAITDNPAQTILVIEGAPMVSSGLWIEPVDLDISQMQGQLTANRGTEPGGVLRDGVAFATVDGRTHFLPDTTEPSKVLALLTATGGERLPDDALD